MPQGAGKAILESLAREDFAGLRQSPSIGKLESEGVSCKHCGPYLGFVNMYEESGLRLERIRMGLSRGVLEESQ